MAYKSFKQLVKTVERLDNEGWKSGNTSIKPICLNDKFTKANKKIDLLIKFLKTNIK